MRAREVVLSWTVSGNGGPAARGAMLEVRIPWPGAARRVRAVLIDGSSRTPVEAPGGGAWERAEGLWHLDIAGLLSVSMREQGGAARVLYARCELFERLGLAGGRYEFAGGAIAG